MTAAHVLSFTAFWYAAWLLYLLFCSIFAAPIVRDIVVVSVTGQATSEFTCSTRSPAVITVLYAFEGAFLAGSGYLCYATKNVPDAINEAKVIALGEQTILLLSARPPSPVPACIYVCMSICLSLVKTCCTQTTSIATLDDTLFRDLQHLFIQYHNK